MSEFQSILQNIRDNGNIDDISVSDIVSKYNDKDNNFLIDEFINNCEKNSFYTRDLYYIISSLLKENKLKNVEKLDKFLEEKLEDLINISEGNIYIFINLYLNFSKNLKNIKRLYNEFQEKNYINVSNIENFCEAFLKNNDIPLFIETFLYNEENWIRSVFYSYEGGSRTFEQNGILSLNIENFKLFLNELSKQENIGVLINEYEYRKEHDFINLLFTKIRENDLYDKLYNLLISQLIYSSSSRNYNNKSIFSQININLFNELKNHGILTYQKFFSDIHYKEPEYYYFGEFEEFIIKTFETKKDIEEFINLRELIENEYIIRNAYFNIKERLKLEKIQKYFEEVLGDKIEKYIEDRIKAIEESKKYDEEIDTKQKNKIKVYLDLVLNKETKYFVPEFLNAFINQEKYLYGFENEYININNLIIEQINRYFTFPNLEINKKALESFKKTETGYSSYGFMLDGSFEIVYKSAKKIGYDLSTHKDRFALFYPFQYDSETLLGLIKYFDLEQIRKIVEVYKNFRDIRKYQQNNITILYEKKQSFFEIDQKLKQDYLKIIEENLEDDELSKYNYESLLKHLFYLGKEKDYFDKLEKKYKTDKNFFIDGLEKADLDENFDKYNIINEILIKKQDKNAFLWRIKQLDEGFIQYIQKGPNDSQYFRGLGKKESELDFDKEFIKSLGEYKSYDFDIEKKILNLLKKSFEKYNDKKYIIYCKYIWEGVTKYLKGITDIKLKISLINGIANILKNEVNINKIISFKLIFKDIGGSFILKIEKEIEKIKNIKSKLKKNIKITSHEKENLKLKEENELLKKENLELKEENQKKLNETQKLEQIIDKYYKEDIIILTEGESDYYYFNKVFYELLKLGKIKDNTKYFGNYIKKCQNNEWLNFSNINTDSACRYISTFFPEKTVIGIFDTDNLNKTKFKEISLNETDDLKKGGFFETKIPNYYLIFVKTPYSLKKYYNNGISSELLFGEKILKNNMITKKYMEKNLTSKIKSICGKPVYDLGNYYLELKIRNDTPVYDYSNEGICGIYDKKTLDKEKVIHSYKSKNNFGESLKTLKIPKTTLLNFKHIFDGISKAIEKNKKNRKIYK